MWTMLRSRCAGLIALTVLLCIPEARAAAASDRQNPVTTLTYLQALPGERDRLARFLVANWFAMDAAAVDAGLFAGYRLLENAAESGNWDLAVEVTYHDACGYECVADRFEAIRAAHRTVLIDGKSLKDLGRVLHTDTLRPRDAAAHVPRGG